MGLWSFFLGSNKKREEKCNWETTCESCGELLEDCECDWKHLSRQDISMLDFGEDKNERSGTSFDRLDSFEDGE